MGVYDYKERDPLNPDQGSLVGSAIGLGALLLLAHTPIAGKVLGGVFRGGKAIGKGSLNLGKKMALKVPSLLKPAGKAALRAASGMGRAASYASRPLIWAGRHPKAAMTAGLTIPAIMGGAGGLMTTAPYGENPGTESMTYDERNGRGLSPSHLGATGDLTLALHGRR